jgi:hypothetical protein
MNSGNYFFPYVITPNCPYNLLRKMFVFGITVLKPVSRVHKLKIPKYRYYDFEQYCGP